MKTKQITFEEITNLVDKFDFKKVHALMILTGWKWANGNEMKTPTIEEMKNTCFTLLYKLQDNHARGIFCTSLGTGGFYVYSFEYGVKLDFSLCSKSTF